MTLGIILLVALIRILAIPLIDYPDFTVTTYHRAFENLVFTDSIRGYVERISGLKALTLDESLISIIIGPFYKSILDYLPTVEVFFYPILGYILFLFFIIRINKNSKSIVNSIRIEQNDQRYIHIIRFNNNIDKSTKLLLLIPVIPYYLISFHPDILFNIIGLIFVHKLIAILNIENIFKKLKLSNTEFIERQSNKKINFLYVFSLFILSLGYQLIQDNQLILVIFITTVIYISIISKSINKTLYSLLSAINFKRIFNKGLLKYNTVFITIIITSLFILFRFNNLILSSFQYIQILPVAIKNVSEVYTDMAIYGELLTKYSYPVRLAIFITGATLYTPYGFGISLIERFLYLTYTVKSTFELLNHEYTSERLKSLYISVPITLMLIIAIIPIFTTFKYWLCITPLWTYLLSINYKSVNKLIIFSWTSILIRGLVSLT
tara:strand:- start:4680 stop:5990 length:1311 start_codon:yes stop_codon:yes gene_type:complete